LVFAQNCDDGNACSVDSFDPNTGGCRNDYKDCSDGNACTFDGCDFNTGICSHDTVTCYDDNVCTDDSCDPINGCAFPYCPGCVQSSSNGIDQLCNGTSAVSSLTAGSITTDSLTVTGGSKKRGLALDDPAFRVFGAVSISGPLQTTTFITESVMVTGSLTISTPGGGGSSFDLSQGISTKSIECTSLTVDGPTTVNGSTTVNSLNVNSDSTIGNRLTTKDATVTGTLDLPVMHFTPPQNKQWWNMSPGSVFSLPFPNNPSTFLLLILVTKST